MKFRTGKFLRDRDESKKRSQNGELDFLKYKDSRSDLKEIMTNTEIKYSNFSCVHLNDIGCDLPFVKRTLSECKNCPMMK